MTVACLQLLASLVLNSPEQDDQQNHGGELRQQAVPAGALVEQQHPLQPSAEDDDAEHRLIKNAAR